MHNLSSTVVRDSNYYCMNPTHSSKTITAADLDKDEDDDLILWAPYASVFIGAKSNLSSFAAAKPRSDTSSSAFDGGAFLYGDFFQ